MHLEQLGFDNFDVTELRFFCTSNHETKPKFIHFKTHNEKVIKVAMNGDQSSLNVILYIKYLSYFNFIHKFINNNKKFPINKN